MASKKDRILLRPNLFVLFFIFLNPQNPILKMRRRHPFKMFN
jgi:hypothetical protein